MNGTKGKSGKQGMRKGDLPVNVRVTAKGKVAVALMMLRSWTGFTGDDEMIKIRRLLKEALEEMP